MNKNNVGILDRAIRLLFAVLVGVLYLTGVISGTLAIVLAAVAVIIAFTSAVSFCPFYRLFGLTSEKAEATSDLPD